MVVNVQSWQLRQCVKWYDSVYKVSLCRQPNAFRKTR